MMAVIIILLIVGAVGYWFFWSVSKLKECQAKYDEDYANVLSRFNNCKEQSGYFEKMGQCILEADKVFANLYEKYPKYILVRLKVNYDGMHTMYKELLEKLYSSYENAIKSNVSLNDVLKLVQNMHDSKQFAVQPKMFVETINNNNKKIQDCYVQIQDKLDNNFKKIAQEFLQKSTYDSVLASIWDCIDEQQEFMESFSKYEIKPQSNSKQISYMRFVAEKITFLRDAVINSDDCYMIADNEYGKCEKEFLEQSDALDTQTVMTAIQEYDSAFEKGDFEKIINTDLKVLSSYVWHCAMMKPFSTETFEKITKLYNGFFKNIYTAEILLAELYYIKQMGGDSIIRKKIDDLLNEQYGKIREMIKYNVVIDKVGDNKPALIEAIRKHTNMPLEEAEKIINGHTSIVKDAIDYNQASTIMYDLNRTGALASIGYHHNTSSKLLTTIASGLMWMGAYDGEKQVLEYMLSKQLPMNQKQQDRLHSLNNGGGDAPKGYSLSSSNDTLYFDISSISWRDEEYKGLFENLAFEEKVLTYSIAVRDEDKELVISKRVKLPEQDIVLKKIKKIFDDEYGETVVAKGCHCYALSGTNQEELNGILVQSLECLQMGVFMHMACIGKKFTIKFYTLFMPESKILSDQKQQLLSIFKKMSPSVTMWENSLKDTVLIAIQQLLNELPSSNTVVSNGKEVEF